MSHYHVMIVQAMGVIAEHQCDNYEDSVQLFMGTAKQYFADSNENIRDLTLERVVQETEHGESGPVLIGTKNHTIWWRSCDQCINHHLN